MSPENTYRYDNHFHPPSPVLNIELRSPDNPDESRMINIPGQLDTGSDGTLIPMNLIEELGLCQVDEILVGGYDTDENDMELRPIFSASITINPLSSFIAQVLPEYKEKDYALIGRDIINKMLITLDGPRNQMYIIK